MVWFVETGLHQKYKPIGYLKKMYPYITRFKYSVEHYADIYPTAPTQAEWDIWSVFKQSTDRNSSKLLPSQYFWMVQFGLVSFFDGITNFLDYFMPKLSL